MASAGHKHEWIEVDATDIDKRHHGDGVRKFELTDTVDGYVTDVRYETNAAPIAPGTKLNNGATVIDSKSRESGLYPNAAYVLAQWGSQFVVWTVDVNSLDAFWGHYFRDITKASAYYADPSKKWDE